MASNLEFGVSTWLWESPFTTETTTLFPKIREMGFDVVEIPVEDPELIDGQRLKEELLKNNLKPTVCGVFGPTKDLTSEDVSLHKNCFRYVEQCFKLCQILGVDFLAGPMYSSVGKARMIPVEQRKKEWDLSVTNLRKVCELAENYGQSIALEPLNRFETDLINTTRDVVQLVSHIDHPSAKILLDSFHMTIEETNIREAIRLAGSKLIHVQVSENHRGIPGSGLTPWSDFVLGLSDINYQGAVVIESFTPEIQELAGAVCIWKNLAESQDQFAVEGLQFLRESFLPSI